ncbi:MAG TPA: hypothetical protein VGE34_00995 [Candidatus Saccharimonadales bacterium]
MLAKDYYVRYHRAMREVGDTFFDKSSGPFSGQIFDQCDTDYNLDYIDSNGQRHWQLLADYSFPDTPDTALIKSQLYYFPVEDQEEDNIDYFIGIVESKFPMSGRRRIPNAKTLGIELMHELDQIIRLNCEIDFSYDPKENTAVIFVTDIVSDEPVAISIKILDDSIQYRFILNSDPEQPTIQRHFDAELSAELWTFLHNFGTKAVHPLLEEQSLDEHIVNKTLKVGLERAPDACRFGIALLEGLTAFDNLQLEQPLPRIAPTLQYEKLDTHFQDYSDDALRRVIERAITLAYRSKRLISTHSLLESVRFEEALSSLINE